jgi:2-polyprenyl-6-methoxyphenol hydroxylase-like FAD-dependent oxidoreductase
MPNHIRRSWGPGWALVGDAGMHRDPITGHGMTDAFRDAELLSVALHGVLTGAISDREADGLYHDLRHELAVPLFEATVALTRFPEPTEFLELQVEAGRAMEDEARFLAARPPIAPAPVAA